jgi:hypothetical protein
MSQNIRKSAGLLILTIMLLTSAVWLCVQTHARADDARKQTVETDNRGYTTRYLYQPNPEHGVFEVKQTDKDGNVTQWYQHFDDEEGKTLIDIVRRPGEKPADESIQFITYNVYRPDGNIAEFYEYTGNGVLRQRVKYVYDEKGNWIEGIIYDANGKKKGKELTPPESWLYGKKKKSLSINPPQPTPTR